MGEERIKSRAERLLEELFDETADKLISPEDQETIALYHQEVDRRIAEIAPLYPQGIPQDVEDRITLEVNTPDIDNAIHRLSVMHTLVSNSKKKVQ